MILEFGSVINPVLVELVNVNHPLAHPDDMNAILRKDAVYSAIGLAAFELYDEVSRNFLIFLRNFTINNGESFLKKKFSSLNCIST